ncbi:MAG: AMP-binding protein [Bacteroidetes bacterium]|jgi:acyl-CoA synthetase (AMP-forming)/AMP-acid ligase II|nr:AMP-binding protein [Bacteroidota bacterium]
MKELPGSIDFKAIYFRGKKYDQPYLLCAIDHLAAYLNKNIRSESPFVLLATYNHIKTVIAYYAILRAGKIAVILDPECKTLELAEIIEDVDPGAIIFLNSTTLQFDYEEEIVLRTANRNFVISSDLTDVCTIAYTNAEDGYSKGAMLTEHNLRTEIINLSNASKIDMNSVICPMLPFHHLYGLITGILIATQSGGVGLINNTNLMYLNNILSDIQLYGVTHFFTVPSVYYLLSKCEGIDYMAAGVKQFISGGNKLSHVIFEKFYQKTGKKINEGYGLTETSPACTLNYQDDEPVSGSIGIPLKGCEIKILNTKQTECGPDEIGEICIKGDLVFKGYFNHPTATDAVIRGDWFHTGDLGMRDKKGLLYFTGLKKNMFNVAGNNVYPEKLKRLMSIHKNVNHIDLDVENSFLQGHTVNAVIRLNKSSIDDQQQFKTWCTENINNIILPKKWQFI